MLLEGARIVVTGVLTPKSIAFAVARAAQREGAEVLLTSFGRARSLTERTAGRLDPVPEVIEFDATDPGAAAALGEAVTARWPHVDGVLHAIAFAPEDALGGHFVDAPDASARTAFEVSAMSMRTLAAGLREPMAAAPRGASLVGLDFDAAVAWPLYDWMGVAKAALESVSRYLARDLGPQGIRSNLVAAGPLRTLAARSIPGFDDLAGQWQQMAPLGWDVSDPEPAAEACAWLLSPRSRGITGEIVHVDGGFHAVGAPGGGPSGTAAADAAPPEMRTDTQPRARAPTRAVRWGPPSACDHDL